MYLYTPRFSPRQSLHSALDLVAGYFAINQPSPPIKYEPALADFKCFSLCYMTSQLWPVIMVIAASISRRPGQYELKPAFCQPWWLWNSEIMTWWRLTVDRFLSQIDDHNHRYSKPGHVSLAFWINKYVIKTQNQQKYGHFSVFIWYRVIESRQNTKKRHHQPMKGV